MRGSYRAKNCGVKVYGFGPEFMVQGYYPYNGESNGKEHGKLSIRRDCIAVCIKILYPWKLDQCHICSIHRNTELYHTSLL